MNPVTCDCQAVALPVGALSVWCDHIEHTETACVEDQQ